MSSYSKHQALFAGKWAAQQAKAGWGDNLAPDTDIVQPAERSIGGADAFTSSGVDCAVMALHSHPRPPSPSKYRNVREGAYASKREAKRAAVLRLLEDTKVISDLREQVEFVLIPAQYENGKCVERACTYTADFVYTDNATGKQVVEDCKGFPNDRWPIKRKLMRFTHGITIFET